MSTTRLLRPLRHLHPQFRAYHSPSIPQSSPYTPTETAILSSALTHVPSTGFTTSSLRSGLRANGYLDASTALFPAGAYELVRFHHITSRLSLHQRVQFPSDAKLTPEQKIRALVKGRLGMNAEAELVGKMSEAFALMAMPSHLGGSIAELARLADEVLFLAGDGSVDASWYGKRAGLSGVYASAELFQSQDQSTDFKDTEAFLDRRLEESRTVGNVVRDFGEWAGFQGVSAVNLARSWGMRI